MGQNGNRTGKFGGNGCGITALEFIELPTTAPSTSSNQLVALAVTISYPTTTALSGDNNV